MNRLLLLCTLLFSSLALANSHHHSSGGSHSSSSGIDLEKEGACLVWAAADAGVDGGDPVEEAEAADAGHPGEVCAEHAKTFGCSSSAAAPFLLLAAAALSRKKKS